MAIFYLIFILLHAFGTGGSPEEFNQSNAGRKRRLNMGTSLGGKSAENELWNEMHVGLVRDLEKRGTLWCYGTKHLKLWTDQIVSGTSGGVNDEPVWEEHIDAVLVPPKVKKPQSTMVGSCSPPNSTNQLLEMMLLQQQQRRKIMQTSLLACISSNLNSPKPQLPEVISPAVQPLVAEHGIVQQKGLHQLTTDECLDVLRSIGLPQHCSIFKNSQVDGPMLEALIHPHLGQQILSSLGVNDPSDCHCLITDVCRLKSQGYNKTHSTNSSL